MGELKEIDKKVIAIIPAKGNSTLSAGKGLNVGKNVRILNGKPLIAWTIEASLASKLVDRTIVSTDDVFIADLAKLYGAEVIMRPAELCQPLSPTEGVLLHAVEDVEKRGYFSDVVVLLQATSPIRRKGDIDNSIRKLVDTNADSLMSVHEIRDTFWVKEEGKLKSLTYDVNDHQSRFHQNAKSLIRENGAINITKTSVLKSFKNRLAGKIETYNIPEKYALELHDEDDFWLAGRMLERIENET